MTTLKKENCIYLNGQNSNIIYLDKTISQNDVIEIDLSFNETSENIIAKNIKLDIMYEDESLLIVNKPAHMPVHPSHNHYEDSLSNGVKYYFEKIGLHKKIRPVNRLDKDTSGIVIFAKNEYIQECLVKQMQTGEFKKKYLAILEGILDEKKFEINAPIARKSGSIIEREVNPNGSHAITYLKVIKEFNNLSLVEFSLQTGRTHQLRVHSKYIGHPILGDTLYGNSSNLIEHQALHAYKIEFIHPITKEQMQFVSKGTGPFDTLFNNLFPS